MKVGTTICANDQNQQEMSEQIECTEYDAIRRFVSDHRNSMQQKTFTKWVNHHLQKVSVTNFLEA